MKLATTYNTLAVLR